jgi:hypothetical protein
MALERGQPVGEVEDPDTRLEGGGQRHVERALVVLLADGGHVRDQAGREAARIGHVLAACVLADQGRRGGS